MNIKRNITVITVTTVAALASAGLSSPAMADRSAPTMSPASSPFNTTITSAPKPNILTWRECWSGHYAMYREDGFSIPAASAGADLACGSSEDKF